MDHSKNIKVKGEKPLSIGGAYDGDKDRLQW